MKAVKTEISGVEVLFEIADDNIEIINGKKPSKKLKTTEGISHENIGDLVKPQGIANFGGSSKEITDKDVKKVSEIIAAFAKDCKSKLNTDISPDEMEIEFSLALGGETGTGFAGVWIFAKAEAKSSIKVRMKWNKNNPAKQGE